MGRTYWRMARTAVLGILLALLVMCIMGPAKVTGSSMEPTMGAEDLVIINKASYLAKAPDYGDIIVFESDVFADSEEGKLLVKRVVAKSGDRVEIKDGMLYRNDVKLLETYAGDVNKLENMDEIEIKDGCVFVLGDNRINSRDSRDVTIGQIEEEDIIGRVDFRLLPLSRLGIVK